MQRSTFILTLVLAAAACKPQGVERALDAANTALGATRIAVNEAAEVHKQLTIEATRACAAELGMARSDVRRAAPAVLVAVLVANTTPEQRRACLERHGFSPEQTAAFERALDKVSEGYDLIVEALGLIEEGWAEARKHLEAQP